MSLIGLLIALVIACLVFWSVNAILGAFKIGDPIATVVKVAFVIVVVLWLVSAVFGVGPGIRLR